LFLNFFIFLCYFNEGAENYCQDFGAPLMLKETVGVQEKMFVVGIANYGECCGDGRPEYKLFKRNFLNLVFI
jgi:hypothetical protein